MIRPEDIFHIRFYDKSPFYGSYQGMHYRIQGIKDENDQKVLQVIHWPGPYNFATTDDSLKTTETFPYSNEGLEQITEYLNKCHAEQYEKD